MTDPWRTIFLNSWFCLKLLNWKWSNLTIRTFCLQFLFSNGGSVSTTSFNPEKLNQSFVWMNTLGLEFFPFESPFSGLNPMRSKAQQPPPWVLGRRHYGGRRLQTTAALASAGHPWHPGSAQESREVGGAEGRDFFGGIQGFIGAPPWWEKNWFQIFQTPLRSR